MLKFNIKLISILVFGLLIRVYGILVLSLGEWDERYHALVAKNLIKTPLHPYLIADKILPLDANDWTLCEIWLAKPPLAFWFMSLSMKVFGENEFGLRFPSLIFSTLSIYLTYLIGRKLYNESVGLWAAFFYAVNGLLYEINIGLLSGDHVDTLFHLLMQVAMHSMISQENKSSLGANGLIVGALSGLAFLTKWTMSFFIIAVCMLVFIYNKPQLKKTIVYAIGIFIGFTLISTPWLIWIFANFSDEANSIFNGVIAPVSNVIQGHSGYWYYYLNSIRININELIYLPLLFSAFITFKKQDAKRVFLAIWIFLPLILLSSFETKREVYIMMSATPLFISMSYFINFISRRFYKNRKLVWFVKLIFILLAVRYSIERIKPQRPRLVKPDYRKEMESLLSKNNYIDSLVIINDPNYLDARFYYNLKAYPYLDETKVAKIKQQGFKIYECTDGKYLPK